MADTDTNKDRFALFGSTAYYPGGGFHDLITVHDSAAAAMFADMQPENDYDTGPSEDWYQIVDLHTLKIVAETQCFCVDFNKVHWEIHDE